MKTFYKIILFILILILYMRNIRREEVRQNNVPYDIRRSIEDDYIGDLIYENVNQYGAEDKALQMLHRLLKLFNFTLCITSYEGYYSNLRQILPPYLNYEVECKNSGLELVLTRKDLNKCLQLRRLSERWCFGIISDEAEIDISRVNASPNLIIIKPKFTRISENAQKYKIMDDANIPFWPKFSDSPEIIGKSYSHRRFLIGASVERLANSSAEKNLLLQQILPGSDSNYLNLVDLLPHGADVCSPNIKKESSENISYPCSQSIHDAMNANFCLIMPTHSNHRNSEQMNMRSQQLQLLNCLLAGSIPVILSVNSLLLDDIFPFYLLLKNTWLRAVVLIEVKNQGLLLDYLRAIPYEEQLRRRFLISQLLHRHLKTRDLQLQTVFLYLHKRLGLPKLPEPNIVTQLYPMNTKMELMHPRITSTFMMKKESGGTENVITDHKFSPVCQHLSQYYHFRSMPQRPVSLVTQTKKVSFESGPDQKSDVNKDQFTVIILTHDRYKVLQNTLKSLNGLKPLHSVIVIWNNQYSEPDVMAWPHLHRPIRIIKSPHNDLNVRFLPFDLIETEAIFSLDDDQYFTHAEYLEGFSLWKENQDSLVGFHDRRVSWNVKSNSFDYLPSSDHYSMILTGAVFLHRFYLFMYTYGMTHTIREFVAERMNCEDIAMNFLVSHLTGRPPIKIRRSSFLWSSGKRSSLSGRQKHYLERSECVNIFVSIYGYLPLKNSSFNARKLLFLI